MGKTSDMQKAIQVADDACNNTLTKIGVLEGIYSSAAPGEKKQKAFEDWRDACRKLQGEHDILMAKLQALDARVKAKKKSSMFKSETINAAETFLATMVKLSHTYLAIINMGTTLK